MAQYTADQARLLAADAYERYFGRRATEQELAAAIPQFQHDWQGGEKGNAWVADIAAREKQMQDELDRPDKERAKLDEKAKEYAGAMSELIKGTLGRDATDEEAAHFARLRAQGYDEYEIGEALKMLPEYTEREDQSARDKLRGELSTADQRFFGEKIMPTIQSRFAQQGRSVDSSGYAAALANAAQGLNTERESYLAGIGREDYTNRRQLAINQYLSRLNTNQASQDYGRARADQVGDVYRGRAWELQDYDTQRRAYEDYLRNNGVRKQKGLGSGLGSFAGMGLGALLAAPTGGMSILAGATLGGAMGGVGGGLFDSYPK
jgi:hypothetical protein